MREETLTHDFILGHAYGPGLGHLGLGLFFETGLISGPPPKMGGIFGGGPLIRPASVNRF